jgi:hypothetical protein
MKLCSVEGCSEKHFAKGYCSKHFGRYRRLGDPLAEVKEQGERLPVEMINCQYCGKKFKPKRDRRKKQVLQKYCSVDCCNMDKKQIWPTTKIYPVSCTVCGNAFIARNSRQNKCSDECRKKHTKQYNLERDKQRSTRDYTPRKCKECGAIFKPVYGDKRKIYCSPECSTNAYRRTDAHKISRKECNKRRRARERNAIVEMFNTKEMFNRDKWICQICGLKVDSRLKYPHPKSASLDHRIALSNGGSHTEDNVQLAHLGCNSSKGNRQYMANKYGQLMIV